MRMKALELQKRDTLIRIEAKLDAILRAIGIDPEKLDVPISGEEELAEQQDQPVDETPIGTAEEPTNPATENVILTDQPPAEPVDDHPTEAELEVQPEPEAEPEPEPAPKLEKGSKKKK